VSAKEENSATDDHA